ADARKKGFEAGDTMHEPEPDKEFKRVVTCNGRRAWAADRRHDVVGAERLMAGRQSFQHLATDWGEPLRGCRADLLGMGNRVGSTARMVVTRIEKHGGHARNLVGRTLVSKPSKQEPSQRRV